MRQGFFNSFRRKNFPLPNPNTYQLEPLEIRPSKTNLFTEQINQVESHPLYSRQIRLIQPDESLIPILENPWLTQIDFPITDVNSIQLIEESYISDSSLSVHTQGLLISNDILVPLSISKLRGKKYLQDDFKDAFKEEKPTIKSTTREKQESKEPKPEEESIEGIQFLVKRKSISFFDLIKPLLMPPLESFEAEENLFFPPEKKPYDYQIIGIEKLIENKGFLLADEMGTGKTVMATLAMRVLFRRNKIKKALVVCPVSLLNVWREHIEEWGFGELISVVAHGTRKQRRVLWKSPAHVFITSYDTYRSDIYNDNIPLDKRDFDLVIMDEAQYIKNTGSRRHKAIHEIIFQRRWAITGTPLENDINDVKAIFSIIRPNYIPPEEDNLTTIRELIKSYMLRRLKKDVLKDLPPKTYQILWMPLTSEQQKQYNALKIQGTKVLQGLVIENRITKQHVFALITKLKQICNFPEGSLYSSKANATVDMVEEITSSDNKLIIFSQFIDEGIEKLNKIFSDYGIVKLDGSMSQAKRQLAIEEFRNNPKISIFLISLKAGGVGLTLTEANYVIHFDQWWNPATMRQAEDRVHRSGQTKPVTIYELWMENTIEERIYNILQKKKMLSEQVIDSLAEEVSLDELDITMDEWLYEVLEISAEGTIVSEEEAQEIKIREEWEAEEFSKIRLSLFTVSPLQFEKIIAELFKHLGYPDITHTGQPGDEGIDVFAQRSTPEGKEIVIIQCKRYINNVGVSEVRELGGTMLNMSGNVTGYLVSASEFTNSARIFAARSKGKIKLMTGMEVAQNLLRFNLTHLLK